HSVSSLLTLRPPISTLFPYTTLFRSFSYQDALFLNGTLRNDWFSTLSEENRSILYPSVTGSFVFSQPFKNFPAWISFGKIRAGYAEVGSDTDVSPYSNNLFYRVDRKSTRLNSSHVKISYA